LLLPEAKKKIRVLGERSGNREGGRKCIRITNVLEKLASVKKGEWWMLPSGGGGGGEADEKVEEGGGKTRFTGGGRPYAKKRKPRSGIEKKKERHNR